MSPLTETQIDAMISLGSRVVALAENYWRARTRLLETPEVEPHAEVWKQGEPRKAETREEYRDLPTEGAGRFSDLVRKGRP